MVTNLQRYMSHTWTTEFQSYGDIQPGEYITYCIECGIEERGHPSEFPELEYPHCYYEEIDESDGGALG